MKRKILVGICLLFIVVFVGWYKYTNGIIKVGGYYREPGKRFFSVDSIQRLDENVILVSGGTSKSTLYAFDIGDIVNPKLLGTYETNARSDSFAVQGSLAFIALWGKEASQTGVALVDFSQPDKPVQIGFFPNQYDLISSVIAYDHFLLYYQFIRHYAGEDKSTLTVIDIANPELPTEIITFQHLGKPILIHDGYLFATKDKETQTESFEQLLIYDLQDIKTPKLVSETRYSGIEDLYVQNDFAYLLLWEGVVILDISTPSSPQLVGEYRHDQLYANIIVHDSKVYISHLFEGISVLDVSDPQNPTLLQRYRNMFQAKGLFWVSDYLYVADGQGLFVFKIP